MTIPIERTWSLKKTRAFLYKLLDREKTPRVPKHIRVMARSCLRHFPSDHYIEEAADKAPNVFGKDE